MSWSLPRLFLTACFALLALGTVVRPVLIVMCEIHAARFAHADNPHAHQHDEPGESTGDASTPQDTHGDHDPQQPGSLVGIDASVAIFVPALAFRALPLPMPSAGSIPDPRTGAPFRPPIA